MKLNFPFLPSLLVARVVVVIMSLDKQLLPYMLKYKLLFPFLLIIYFWGVLWIPFSIYLCSFFLCLVHGWSDWEYGGYARDPSEGLFVWYLFFKLWVTELYWFYVISNFNFTYMGCYTQQFEELQEKYNVQVRQCHDLSGKLDSTEVRYFHILYSWLWIFVCL